MTKTWYVLKVPNSDEYFYNHSDGTYYTTTTKDIERAQRFSDPEYAEDARMHPHAYNYKWEMVQVTMNITEKYIKSLKEVSTKEWHEYCKRWE